MVNKCSVTGCSTNHRNHETGAVFKLPKNEELRKHWIKFINRGDINDMSYVFACDKHFEEKYLKRNANRVRLVKTSENPVPTIFSDSQKTLPSSVLPTVKTIRKPPVQRIFQRDQLNEFQDFDRIKNFSEINNSLLKHFLFEKHEKHATFYKLERTDEFLLPKVTSCIYIDSSLHVKLFYEGSPIPLPKWFCHGRNATLTRKSMLENFESYIQNHIENNRSILEEIRSLQYQEKPTYSAGIIRYALMLRYTSLPAYKILLKELKLPSISFLKKLTAGDIDATASLKLLKSHGKISDDVILMFDEMYLEKCEEYIAGKMCGSDENGELFKGIVCFMIVGLKNSISYVVRAFPEKKINGDWIKDKILECLDIIDECGFTVRGVVCDDHSSNVSAYKKLHSLFNANQKELYVKINGKKIYLFFDTVHLMKNLRNNLLNRKRFLFPAFSFTYFKDTITFEGGEISWRLLHEVHEKDEQLQSHLRAAPQLTAKVLHPGNCKQSVPPALAVFHQTTIAAIKKYFPERQDAAGFLQLINCWWTISNSKTAVHTSNRLGDASRRGDNKPLFLRMFADWIEAWSNNRIPNAETFTLSAQTSHALMTTVRCHAALIEDLINDDYEFVLTSRFQSDPLERRYGQYRQMSGGRFLVSLKDIGISEKILKIKSLLRENIDFNESVKVSNDHQLEVETLLSKYDQLEISLESLNLNEDSREVSDVIAGYISRKMRKYCEGCCIDGVQTQHSSSVKKESYLAQLSRGGLIVPSEGMSDYVARAFTVLDISSDIICKSTLPERLAAESILKHIDSEIQVVCQSHERSVLPRINRIITNIFFNNKRKISSASVVVDRLKAFKRCKREK